MNQFLAKAFFSLSAIPLCAACDTIDDNRIPSFPVSINLSDAGLWNSFGVAGFGIEQRFIKGQSPAGFHYSETTYTGFGGVLLIGGMNPYTGDTFAPLAYDLACPVEVDPEVRVNINQDNFTAVCPVCGSVYDVTMAAGAPLSGPAAKQRFKLKDYNVIPTTLGGYVISR